MQASNTNLKTSITSFSATNFVPATLILSRGTDFTTEQIINDHVPNREEIVKTIVDQAIMKSPPSNTVTTYTTTSTSLTTANDYRGIILGEEKTNKIVTNDLLLPHCDQRPEIHEIHHIDRPIEFVNIDNVRDPWEHRYGYLERQKKQLLHMLNSDRIQKKIIRIEDTARCRQLQLIIEDLEDQINDRQNMIRKLQPQVPKLEKDISFFEQKGSALEQEQGNWRNKFIELNRMFHNCQEKLMFAKADYESKIKQQQVTVTKTVTVTNQQKSSQRVAS